ncbi:CheY-like chemotaxis protein [Saonia flava]|uniref:CheY-like chemotaxis protein n=1 Tax=Saonia flava TaxID=523696 RepID=A0A846QVR9_9FLAO|nr:response regulator [Saonia flava]NJB72401.1 CheY-like chemotaxis protein [Saonia flava]
MKTIVKPFIISIVDDDDIYQFTIARTIKTHGLARKILTFSDGEKALDFMLENIGNNDDLPDIIFLDINMPVMDGFQFMEEYVKIKPRVGKKITIYMVSSSVDPADIERANKIGDISDYIIKPIQPGELLGIVEALEKNGDL